MSISLQHCREMDTADPLARYRDAFALPERIVYLDGNSLGALPKQAEQRVRDVMARQWGQDLIKSWNLHDWIGAPQRVGAKIARLIGAQPHEVVVADSTSLNVFKALDAVLRLRPDRHIILSDDGNFPTDLYMAQGLAKLLGAKHELKIVSSDQITASLTKDVAVLMLTEVDYRTGQLHDMAALTKAAHDTGALTLWDLAHSAGAFPVDLNGCGADFAVGCGYKYLNGGPGAPAFIFVAERWHERAEQPLFGWMGHDAPFAFDLDYRPRPGIDRFLVGTPPILSLTALEAGLDLFADVELGSLRRKSGALGDLFIALVEQELPDSGLVLASPRSAAERGSQVSFRHPEGYPIMQALIARGVIGDFRAPDILRFGFAPLYVSFVDIWDAVAQLKAVMAGMEWQRPEFRRRAAVT
ncbi:kynureninase [Dongia deserti]|uniref:kynureninase n=1 Tax=Dongia deserti TaxID=2268030 RepID=UPI00254717AD|nr:kynureninase [Dongia deserti]